MTSNDQPILDILASVPGDIAGYGSRVAGYVEKHSNAIAADLRDAIDSASWIPESIRPPVRTAPRRIPTPAPPKGVFAQISSWMSDNRTAVAIVLAFAGTTAILIHNRKKAHTKKRRAHRDRSGKKKEIVVLACSSFQDPLTRSLALDLDRRGYIVYITVTSTEEDGLVQAEEKWDIRPLWMDLTSSVPNPGVEIHPNLEPIRQLIKPSSSPSSPASDESSPSNPSQHILAGLILLPGSTGYPTSPLATLSMTDMIDTVNTRLLSPILALQQFLPLLTLAEIQAYAGSPSAPSQSSRFQNLLPETPSLILAYPSIPTSLHPPNQAPEAMTTSSLSSLIRILGRELAPTSRIHITELKLGLFELGSLTPRGPIAGENVYPQPSAEMKNSALVSHWHSSHRTAAQNSFHNQHPHQQPGISKATNSGGSSLRTFHNAVFDILNPPRAYMASGAVPWGGNAKFSLGSRGVATIYAGQGARTYDLIAKWMPEGLVGWMIRRRQQRGAGPEQQANRARDEWLDSLEQGRRRPRDAEGEQHDQTTKAAPTGLELGPGLGGGSGSAGSGSEIWEQV